MRRAFGLIFSFGLAASLVLAGCGASGGGGSGGGSKAATGGGTSSSSKYTWGTKGNYVMVKFTGNEQVWGAPGSSCPATLGPGGAGPCFDQGGYMLDSTDPAAPNKGTAGQVTAAGIPMYFLGTGGGKSGDTNEAINLGPEHNNGVETVNVPSGQYKNLYLLAAAGNGGGKAIAITYTYTDGSSGSATNNIHDWCSAPTATENAQIGFQLTDRLNPTGTPSGCSNSVYLGVYTIPVSSPTKTLKSIKLDGGPGINTGGNQNFEPEILAITLGK